jgi:hypothetical protein
MRHLFTGIRGRVTMAVLAISAVLFSALATVGFVEIAHSGRDAIRERIGEVLDDFEASIRSGRGTVRVSTADGVTAEAFVAGAASAPRPS